MISHKMFTTDKKCLIFLHCTTTTQCEKTGNSLPRNFFSVKSMYSKLLFIITLIWWNFSEKTLAVKFRNFHTVLWHCVIKSGNLMWNQFLWILSEPKFWAFKIVKTSIFDSLTLLKLLLNLFHSVENSEFSCHSDFTWNRFRRMSKLKNAIFAIFGTLKLSFSSAFRRCKNLQKNKIQSL